MAFFFPEMSPLPSVLSSQELKWFSFFKKNLFSFEKIRGQLNLSKSLVGEISRKKIKVIESKPAKSSLCQGEACKHNFKSHCSAFPGLGILLNEYASEEFLSVFTQVIHCVHPWLLNPECCWGHFLPSRRTKRTPFKSGTLIIISTRFPKAPYIKERLRNRY